MIRRTLQRTILGLLLVGGAILGASAGEPTHVGEVRPGDLAVVNHQTDSRLIADGALVTTQTEPAVIFLDNGRTLKFAPNSAARMAADGSGDVSIRVLAGRVYLSGPDGQILTAGGGGSIRVEPARGDESALFVDDGSELTRGVPRRDRRR